MRLHIIFALITATTGLRLDNRSINHVGFGMNKSHYFHEIKNERNQSTYNDRLHKTGFYYVDCLKDGMLTTGDKHGLNKDSFKDSHPISIVRYSVNTPKEDREKMTPEVCYDFCRRTPQAVFFGLSAGRECYCTPYFSRIAGDSSDCDAPCDGDAEKFCGGMKKSAIYSMHECEGGVTGVLKDARSKAVATASNMMSLCSDAATFNEAVYHGLADCKNMMTAFGPVGDSLTSELAKQSCEVALEASKRQQLANATRGAMQKLVQKAGTVDLSDGNVPSSDDLTELEATLFALERAIGRGRMVCSHLNEKFTDHNETVHGKNDLDMFFPITYYVDKSNKKFGPRFNDSVPSTCVGPAAGKHHRIQWLATVDECAAACDEAQGEDACLAFVHHTDSNGGKCFLLSDVTEIGHYDEPDDCGNNPRIVCGAKFSAMKGFELRLTSKEAGVDHVKVVEFDKCVPPKEMMAPVTVAPAPIFEMNYYYYDWGWYYYTPMDTTQMDRL